jgi:hypothetical protein
VSSVRYLSYWLLETGYWSLELPKREPFRQRLSE